MPPSPALSPRSADGESGNERHDVRRCSGWSPQTLRVLHVRRCPRRSRRRRQHGTPDLQHRFTARWTFDGRGRPPRPPRWADAAGAARRSRAAPHAAPVRERYDWDYLWMVAFTVLLFFRPQDQIPGLAAAPPVGIDRDRRPRGDGRPPPPARAADREGERGSRRRGRPRRHHRPHAAVFDLAGRVAARVQRHLRQDHPDLRADDQHDHLAEARAADDVDHDSRVERTSPATPSSTTCAA